MTVINIYSKLATSYVSVFLILFSWWRLMIYASENDLPTLLAITGYVVPIIPLILYFISGNRSTTTRRRTEMIGGTN